MHGGAGVSPSVRLRTHRFNRGLSLREAADEIGVTFDVLQRAERGAQTRPRAAKKIADFYGCRVTDIWPVDEERQAA